MSNPFNRQRLLALRRLLLSPAALSPTAPLDLRIVGRTLFHAALVGIAAGLSGAAFFAGLEYLQTALLEGVAGYRPLRAYGEEFAKSTQPSPFRPWLWMWLPALGGLLSGLLTRLAPETRGGGADAMIEAFHHKGGDIRRRVIWVKALASMATLGTGGAGGREGPTMQIGGALGALVARLLRVNARERRILLVAGVAAGISAVFRTPLGAALLAVEVLYRDGFESDALIPAVLSSVVGYSVSISLFGESTLFGYVPRFPFVPAHLPLFALLALLIAALAAIFLQFFRWARSLFASIQVPEWSRPALGGLLLGGLATPLIVLVGNRIHETGQGLGILGGGYGAVQMAISGSGLLPSGWSCVVLLLALSLVKVLATSLPVTDGDAILVGLVTSGAVRVAAAEFSDARWALAADLMQPIVSVTLDDNLRTATERMIANSLRELPIVDAANRVVGLVDETDIANMYLRAALRAESSGADSLRG